MSCKMYKFSDVFEFKSKSKIKAGAGKDNGLYPFYTSSVDLKKYINEASFDKESLVFGTGGKASIHHTKGKFSVSTDCLVAQPTTEDINTKFVYYYLYGNIHILEQGFKGAGLQHISKQYISNITFPRFSRFKQDEIVKILDTIESIRLKRKVQTEYLNKYLESIFFEIFVEHDKYPVRKISELATQKKGSMRTGPFGSALKHSEFVKKGIAVLGIDNVVDNEFKWKKQRFITKMKYEELKRYTVFPEDLLITIMGTLGRSAVVPKDVPVAINTKHLACISLNKELANPYFLSYSITHDPYILNQLKLNTRGQ